MKSNNENIKFLQAIIKAKLNKTELSILYVLMKEDTKTITTTYTELAKRADMKQNNFSRDINSMISKNVVAKRGQGIFVKSQTAWGK